MRGRFGRSPNGKFLARAMRQKRRKTGEAVRGRFRRTPQQKNPLAHYFATALSKIKRKPSSVSCEFVSVMVLDALATRGARPPVATTGAV